MRKTLFIAVLASALLSTAAPAYAATEPSSANLAGKAVHAASAPLSHIRSGSRAGGHGVTVTARDAAHSAVADNGSGGAVLTVLHQGSTATFGVAMPAGVLLAKVGQRVVVGGSLASLGYFPRPWARDATGKRLSTSYAVVGSTLVQHVNTTGARYPIVADPSFKFCDFHIRVCMLFSKSQTKSIHQAFLGGLQAGVTLLCGLIPWTPVYVGAVKVVCAVLVTAAFIALKGTFATAVSQGRCVELKWLYVPPTFVSLSGWKVHDCGSY